MGMDISQGFSWKSALQGSLENAAPSCGCRAILRRSSQIPALDHGTGCGAASSITCIKPAAPGLTRSWLSKSHQTSLQAPFLNLTSSFCTASHGNVPSMGSILLSQPEVFVQEVAANHPLLGLLLGLWLSAALSAVTAKVLPGCHSKGAHSLLGCPQGGHVFSHLIPFFCWISGG